jgi:hypothetical protein
MTPIGQPCACEPVTWLYFVFVQSVFVFVGQTLTMERSASKPDLPSAAATAVAAAGIVTAASNASFDTDDSGEKKKKKEEKKENTKAELPKVKAGRIWVGLYNLNPAELELESAWFQLSSL